MTKVLTSLEIYAVISELQPLIGAKVSKIYQPDSRTLIIQFFKTGGKKFNLKINSGIGLYVTSYKFESPLVPLSFCLFLRKYLNGARLVDIFQKDLERIVELRFEARDGKKILICELFSKGNFILCDKDYRILNLASVQKWKDRVVKKGEIYKYPPTQGIDLFALARVSFKKIIASAQQNEIVRVLAHLGFGGEYAEEICYLASVNKEKPISSLSEEEIEQLFLAINQLVGKIKSCQLEPQVYYKEDKPINATPIKLHVLEGLAQPAPTFNHALDILFTTKETMELMEKSEQKFQEEKERLKTIISKQQEVLEAHRAEYEKQRAIAEQIYNNYQTISLIFNKLKRALDSGHDWYSIYQVLEQEKARGIYEAQLVKELKPETREIVLNFHPEIVLTLTKSLEENAGEYYERAKELKRKIEGAQKTIEDVQKKIRALESKREQLISRLQVKTPKLIIKRKQQWYEKFRWFFTSSGLLAVGGRDATTNEILIKKYMEIKDLVFHTEIAGSPFFLLKNGREKATEQDKKEVAIAAASFSKAWGAKLGAEDVFWVFPEQLSKQAPSGEYIAKGAFMIRGKKNYLRGVALELAVGVDKEGRIMAGPKEAVAKHCQNFVEVKIGDVKKSDAAKKIAQILGVPNKLEEIMRVLPAGEFRIS